MPRLPQQDALDGGNAPAGTQRYAQLGTMDHADSSLQAVQRGENSIDAWRHGLVLCFGRSFLRWPMAASDGSSDKRDTYGFSMALPLVSTPAFRERRVRRWGG
jgi:hypothetical protein